MSFIIGLTGMQDLTVLDGANSDATFHCNLRYDFRQAIKMDEQNGMTSNTAKY